MTHFTDEFIANEIRYLDPELNCDPEFQRIRKRGKGLGFVIRALFGLMFLSIGMDIAGLGFVYFKVNPQVRREFVTVTKIALQGYCPL